MDQPIPSGGRSSQKRAAAAAPQVRTALPSSEGRQDQSIIWPVHAKIPGRARFRVRGLKRNPGLKITLDQLLSGLDWVESAKASHITGNLVLQFQPERGFDQVAWELANIREQALDLLASGQNLAPLRQEQPPPSEELQAADGKVEWLKDIMGRVLSLAQTQTQKPWHALPEDEVARELEANPVAGLDPAESAERLKRQGPNLPPEIASRSRWQILAGQFNSLPVALLGVAAGLSVLTGGLLDAAVILGVVAVNGVIGFYTENSAETTINSLKRLAKPTALVIRQGKQMEIAAPDLVAGDLLVLKPGVYVPADARIIKADNLTIDESTLTGESLPVEKRPKVLEESLAALAERRNMVYQGTVVTGGQGLALVTATGARTELGKLQALVQQTVAPETPIERQLGQIGDQLVLLCAMVCSAVFGMGFLRGFGLLQMGRMSISLAAAAVPEGLPAAATTTLALGTSRMGRHGVLIRNLEAVETLGSIQTLCLDKTGTLTENRMKVMEAYVGGRRLELREGKLIGDRGEVAFTDAKELKRLLHVGVLCSETRLNGHTEEHERELVGSPTENALVEMAILAGLDVKKVRKTHTLLKWNHRAEGRPLMTTLHTRSQGGTLLAVKGSPEEVLERSRWHKVNGLHEELGAADRERILAENRRMAANSLRVLGLAYTKTRGDDKLSPNDDLIWLGLIGMADPVRPGVAEAIAALQQAGIRTVMLTGDQKATARSVAEKLGISGGRPLKVLDSARLNDHTDAELSHLAGEVDVFSRVSPSRKLRIVQELQASGQVVAMTGDGVNDSPALKAAEVGIAMGSSGTDVAREVADVVLEKDDLETLIIAVSDGRTTYANIRKSVRFFLGTNMTEIMMMSASLGLGLGAPLNTMQLLWINLISDIFPGLALSMEHPEDDVLKQPPRQPDASIFNKRDYINMTKEATAITATSMGAYAFGLMRYGMGPAASTLAFQSLTISQLLNALSCRSEKRHFWDRSLKPNPYLRWALGGSLALQALTMFLPGLRSFMGLTPLRLFDYIVIGASALVSLFGTEASKNLLPPGGQQQPVDMDDEEETPAEVVPLQPRVIDEPKKLATG